MRRELPDDRSPHGPPGRRHDLTRPAGGHLCLVRPRRTPAGRPTPRPPLRRAAANRSRREPSPRVTGRTQPQPTSTGRRDAWTAGDARDRNPELPDLPHEGQPKTRRGGRPGARARRSPPPAPARKPQIGDSIPAAEFGTPAERRRRRRRRSQAQAHARRSRARIGQRWARRAGPAPGQPARHQRTGPEPGQERRRSQQATGGGGAPERRTRPRRRRARGPQGSRAQGTPRRALPDVRPRRPEGHPDRRARGPRAHRALDLAARRTTSPRSTATSTSAGSRTCCPAWRPPSSTSARRRTPCSTGATCTTTPTTSRRRARALKIEQMLKAKQTIICQVTKNPIGAKGARLTQEVSLPGRFVVLIPNSSTYGISKRLPDDERKRLRAILDKVKPAHHGVIVRTAAAGRHQPGDRGRRPASPRPVGPDRGAGQAVAGARRCCTASPISPCGRSARSSTTTTAAW